MTRNLKRPSSPSEHKLDELRYAFLEDPRDHIFDRLARTMTVAQKELETMGVSAPEKMLAAHQCFVELQERVKKYLPQPNGTAYVERNLFYLDRYGEDSSSSYSLTGRQTSTEGCVAFCTHEFQGASKVSYTGTHKTVIEPVRKLGELVGYGPDYVEGLRWVVSETRRTYCQLHF